MANAGSNNVSAFRILATGKLTPASSSPFSVGSYPTGLAVGISKYLYVINQNDDNISGFSINPNTCNLTPLAGSPFSAGPTNLPWHVANQLKCLTVTYPSAGYVETFKINSGGGIFWVGTYGTGGTTPRDVAVDYAGQHVYVTNFGSNNIAAFSISQFCALSTVAGSPFTAGGINPQGVAVDPTSSYVVTANNGNNTVSDYQITEPAGTLGPATSSDQNVDNPEFVATTGGYAYVTNDGAANNVEVYNPNGWFSGPYPTGNEPWGVATDLNGAAGSGKYLYVANAVDGTVSGYKIGPPGTLTQLSTSPYTAGTDPGMIATCRRGPSAHCNPPPL